MLLQQTVNFLFRLGVIFIFLPCLVDSLVLSFLQQYNPVTPLFFILSYFFDKTYPHFGWFYLNFMRMMFIITSMCIPPTKYELRWFKQKLSKSSKRAKKKPWKRHESIIIVQKTHYMGQLQGEVPTYPLPSMTLKQYFFLKKIKPQEHETGSNMKKKSEKSNGPRRNMRGTG